MPELVLSGKDWGNERSSVTISLGSTAVTSANYDAFVTSINALDTAIQAISYIPLHQTFKAIADEVTDKATNEEGQREKKWRVKYTSTVTGKQYAVEIPGAILTGNLVAGTDFLDLAAGVGLAFKTTFEAEAREPLTNNAVTVDSVQFVGRAI